MVESSAGTSGHAPAMSRDEPRSVKWTPEGRVVRLLDLVPELGSRLSKQAIENAAASLAIPVHYLRRGAWDPERVLDDRRSPIGMLVLDGVLARAVSLGSYRDVELLGRGDVLAPWHEEPGSVSSETIWRVIEDASVAILDRTFERACTRYPGVMGELLIRSVQRAQRQAAQRAISHVRGVELRVLLVLWQLADRWGAVTSDGVTVPLRVSQDVLAELAGARRPSVSVALGKLQTAGLVERHPPGWLLHGLPPDPATASAEAHFVT